MACRASFFLSGRLFPLVSSVQRSLFSLLYLRVCSLASCFIEKIIVHEKKYLDGKRYQVIDIYFYGVGIIKELTPEEMEAEFQKLAKQEKSA